MQSVNAALRGLMQLFKFDMFVLTQPHWENVCFLKLMGQKVRVHLRVQRIMGRREN